MLENLGKIVVLTGSQIPFCEVRIGRGEILLNEAGAIALLYPIATGIDDHPLLSIRRQVYNDARRNLIISMLFASSTDFAEVCIFFNDRLLRGARSSKVNRYVI